MLILVAQTPLVISEYGFTGRGASPDLWRTSVAEFVFFLGRPGQLTFYCFVFVFPGKASVLIGPDFANKVSEAATERKASVLIGPDFAYKVLPAAT